MKAFLSRPGTSRDGNAQPFQKTPAERAIDEAKRILAETEPAKDAPIARYRKLSAMQNVETGYCLAKALAAFVADDADDDGIKELHRHFGGREA